ncbi:hypothetical protein LTR27_001735 [Elasticomyces elasticus]|nr:hypothetical protein LTR27_001735 [Elasticomyces elasticus]
MTPLKRVDGGFPPITQLSDMQDLTLATAIRPSNVSETSALRQMLHRLDLKYTLSRTSRLSVDQHLECAEDKRLQWLQMSQVQAERNFGALALAHGHC